MSLGAALLVAVVSLREQAHRNFIQEGLGVDAVLGPKGSPLQIILNALYHLDEMPGKIKWTYYEAVLKDPIVEEGIPFITGHSYGGFRVNAIAERFFTDFEYVPGKHFSLDPRSGGQGRLFAARDEAVVGWAAARALKLRLGDSFNPVCGVHSGDPVHEHDQIQFVGIIAPTGTPHDRAIYIPLKTFFTLEGHGNEVAVMATDPAQREISGAYLKIKRIRGGALHPDIQNLKYTINQSSKAQCVIPNEVLPQLFGIIGWADRVLFAMALLVSLLSVAFLFTSLVNALRERRRDLALIRSLGANRCIVFGLIITESLVITAFSAIIGLVFGHVLVGLGAHYVDIETGLRFSAFYFSPLDYLLLPVMLLLGLLTAIIPGIQAYRLGVLKNLTQIS